MREVGANARGVQGDVGSLADLDRLYATVGQEAGRIDGWSPMPGTARSLPLQDITEAHYDSIFASNVKGTLFTVQKALPLLRDGASVIPHRLHHRRHRRADDERLQRQQGRDPNFARSWIQDLAPRRIRVNVLVPGATSTPGWYGLTATEEQRQEMLRYSEGAAPLGRLGDPSETAAAALFLASDDSSYVTGSELFVDGGSAQI